MKYLSEIIALLEEVQRTQGEAIEQAAQAVARCIQEGHLVYIFGAAHAGILAQELFYRAGGLVPVNPILPPGLTTDVRPVTLTTRLERLPGFGRQIIEETPLEPGDVLIVHSVSGRNAAAVEVAQAGLARGAFIIAVTARRYSSAVQSRQAGMPRLFEVADLVLDDCAPIGDALVALPGLAQRVGAASTITGAALLNAMVVRSVELLLERTGEAPVFVSANLDGGEEMNRKWLEKYQGRLTYL